MAEKYDAIVVGAGNGGLVAATKLALSGKKTLLLEKHNIPGGFATSFVRGRFEFEASLHELCGIGPFTPEGGPLKKIFDDLGVSDRIEWVTLDEAYRTMTIDDGDDNFDYSLPLGRERFIAKVQEYAPGTEDVCNKLFDLCEVINNGIDFLSSIDNFTSDTLKSIFGEHLSFINIAGYSVNQVFDALNVPKKVRDIFSGYWCYLGVDLDRLNFMHYFTMLHSYIVEGAVIPKTRSHGISCALLDRFEELGGEAWFNSPVRRIIVRDNRTYGVLLEDGREILSDYVVCNASPYNAYTKLIDTKEIPKFRIRDLNSKKLAVKGFAVFIGLNRSFEELGLNNHTYFIYNTGDTERQFEMSKRRDTNSLQATVCLNTAIPDCSPEGTSILYMTSFFAGDDSWNDITAENYVKTKREFAEKMVTVFEEATGCKIREHIEEIEIAAPVTYAHYTDAPNGTIYGFEASGTDTIVHRIANQAFGKKIDHLYFAGGYTLQCIGFSPSYTTGNLAAEAVLADMRKEAAAK